MILDKYWLDGSILYFSYHFSTYVLGPFSTGKFKKFVLPFFIKNKPAVSFLDEKVIEIDVDFVNFILPTEPSQKTRVSKYFLKGCIWLKAFSLSNFSDYPNNFK